MNRQKTEQSLLQQMRFNEIEISRRMELFGLSEEQCAVLESCQSLIMDNIDDIVNEFYEKQTADDEIALLIGDSDTLARLHAAQRKYVLDLFSGYYDLEYVNNRLRIGLVHKRIGVEPKLYLSAIKTLKNIITGIIGREIDDQDTRTTLYEAVDRVLYFDITLVFDTYIRSLLSEIETEKNRTETYARSLETKVAERTRQLEELVRRDPLTNLYNRRALQEMLHREFSQAIRRSQNISFAYIDVDNFKEINDTHGHYVGDDVIRDIGTILLRITRDVDIPCRYGGDEFCVVLVDCDKDNAARKCEHIIHEFKEAYPDFDLSIGIGHTGPEVFVSPDELIRIADKRMYEAKQRPGTRICS